MVTRLQFAYQLLAALGITARNENLTAITAWETLENTQALNNPLATGRDIGEPGEGTFNASNVQDFPSLAVGVAATVVTLENGLYTPILTALTNGTYDEMIQAIDSSPWGDHTLAGVAPNYAVAINSNDTSIYSQSFTPDPAPAPTPAPQNAPTSYTIVEGDTLSGIAERFHTTVPALYALNANILNSVAREHGRPNSLLGFWIWPGTTIRI